MKFKTVFKVFLLFFLIAVAAIYFFIPSSIRVSKQTRIKGFDDNLYFLLSDSSKWKGWIREVPNSGYSYNVKRSLYPRVFVEAVYEDHKIPVEIVLFSNGRSDSSNLYWQCELGSGFTPWERIQRYKEAVKFKKAFSNVIERFSDYAGKTENTYGISIIESKITDTLVATLSMVEIKLPPYSTICSMISKLREQISNEKLQITDSAMVSRPFDEEGKFTIMVGFPITKMPGRNSNVLIKKMIPGKLLSGTIQGGPVSINNGYIQMKKYITDRYLEEVALPYEVFVTNRCNEKDTAKWKTKICYPVL